MIQRQTIFFVLALPLLAQLGCASTPKPAPLVTLEQELAEPSFVERASKVAPENYANATRYAAMANTAFENGEDDKLAQYSELAQLYTDATNEQLAGSVALQNASNADAKIRETRKKRVEAQVLTERFELRVARMEKIIDLKKQVEGAAADRANAEVELKAELEQAKKESELSAQAQAARLETDRQTAEVRSLISTTSAKVQTAKAINAQAADPANFQAATSGLAKARDELTAGKFAAATQAIGGADKAIDTAIAMAKSQYAQKNKELDLLAERKKLLDEAVAIGAAAKQDERGVVITLQEMFEPAKTEVKADRAGLVTAIGKLANAYVNYPIMVEGYTDAHGASTANLALSTSRAQSVADRLVQVEKVDVARVRAAGYGEERAVADNSTKEGRAKNRRIEVVFLFR